MIFHVLYDCFCLCWRISSRNPVGNPCHLLGSNWNPQFIGDQWRIATEMATLPRFLWCEKEVWAVGSQVVKWRLTALGDCGSCHKSKGYISTDFCQFSQATLTSKGNLVPTLPNFRADCGNSPTFGKQFNPLALLRYCVHTLEPVGDQAPAVPQGARVPGHGGHGRPWATMAMSWF